jgi:hypothetical protein
VRGDEGATCWSGECVDLRAGEKAAARYSFGPTGKFGGNVSRAPESRRLDALLRTGPNQDPPIDRLSVSLMTRPKIKRDIIVKEDPYKEARALQDLCGK